MNSLTELFKKKDKKLLSIYFTAGYPEKESTIKIIESLQNRGVDFLEIGFPFSDPLADGPVIQQTSQQALINGMNMEYLFSQLKEAAPGIKIPLVLMGYLNPVLKTGMENFCRKANEAGISGVILPDLPPDVYESEYKSLFASYNIHMIFLVTPETTGQRIKKIDRLGSGFIYAVSSSSTTGRQDEFSSAHKAYLQRLRSMRLRNHVMTGFGIHNSKTLQTVWEFSSGAIIGTAYLKNLTKYPDENEAIDRLLDQLEI